MLIKKESDYGIRIVRALRSGEQMSVKEICRQEQIPEAFSYKILKKLQRAGLLVAARGVGGGYRLARAVTHITLYDIMIAVEPELSIIGCMQGHCERNPKNSPCMVHKRLLQVQDNIIGQLKKQSMAEILGE